MLLFLLLITSITSITSIDIDSEQLFQPRFDQSYETISVIVGKRALLPCYVSLQDTKNNGFGSFKVIWMKLNNSSILTMEDRAINGDPRISLLHAYAEEWNLQIDDVDEDDAGIYRCFINNGMYKTLILEVKVPPKIIDESTTEPYPASIRTGSNFTIKCYAHGKPTPNIRIISYDQFDNSKIISENNEVTIVNISRYTNSRYECIASNGYPPDVARTFQLTIQYTPEIILTINNEIVTNSLIINPNENEILLKCQVLMNPTGKMYWMKDDAILNSNYRIYQIENYLVSELYIRSFKDDDQGEYKCIASNSLGMDSKKVQLFSSSTTTTTKAMITRKLTIQRKYLKHRRTTTTTMSIIFYSTENLRTMTISSKSISNKSQISIVSIFILFIRLFR